MRREEAEASAARDGSLTCPRTSIFRLMISLLFSMGQARVRMQVDNCKHYQVFSLLIISGSQELENQGIPAVVCPGTVDLSTDESNHIDHAASAYADHRNQRKSRGCPEND
jgi:hypothetical protein